MDNKCKFCEIQHDEIEITDEELLYLNVRVLDCTFKDEIDPMMLFALNMNDVENLRLPSYVRYSGGMVVEQREGVITADEIAMLINTQL